MSSLQIRHVWDSGLQEAKSNAIVEEKNSKWRNVFFTSEVRTSITDYVLQHNLHLNQHQNVSLFTGVQQLTRLVARKHIIDSLLKSLCRKAGIFPPIAHHKWREYVCTTLVSRNVPIDVVAKWIGHANSSTTQNHYLSSFAIEKRVQCAIMQPDISDENNTFLKLYIIRKGIVWARKTEGGVEPASTGEGLIKQRCLRNTNEC